MGTLIKHHVASGSFETGGTQPYLLQAFLGTCVGVAVFDATAGVGGLIHLLLPEPVSSWSTNTSEKYATTGMPLFLKQLLEMGATRENMKAVVAGGALVGPLTSQDMDLDIGGRTTEKVLEALDTHGIDVVRSETGGFFTCCIELDMQCWECCILPAGFDNMGTCTDESIPTRSDVKQAIEAIRPIPQVALKVLRIIENGSYDIQTIAEEVKKDQVMCARTIQLCNSAMFTKHHEIMSLDHALVFLGQELFIKLVISAAVQSYFSQSGNGYSLCKGGLYHHALGTAIISEKIANMTETAIPGIAYTAGLLHDIGKVVLDQYITGIYPMLYREFQDSQCEIIEAETRILGMDHTRVGGLLARKWLLPPSLTNAIRFHHRPKDNKQKDTLTAIVYLADLLMSRFHTGLELERMGTDNLPDYLARLDLSSRQFNDLVELIPGKVFEQAVEMTEIGY